jgi:hypothetical protein
MDKEMMTFYSSNEKIPNLYEKCLIKEIKKESFSNRQYKAIYGDESNIEYSDDISKDEIKKGFQQQISEHFDFQRKPFSNTLTKYVGDVERHFYNFETHLSGLKEVIDCCINTLKNIK